MRLHPAAVLGSVKKLILLLVIPLLHGLIFENGELVYGAWLDVLIFVIAVALAVIRLVKSRIYVDDGGITVINAGFVRSEERFRRSEIGEIALSSGPLYRIAGAVRVEIRLCGAKRRLIIRRRDAERLLFSELPRLHGHVSADAYGVAAFVGTVLAFVGGLIGRDLRADIARQLISVFAGVIGLTVVLGAGYLLLWYDAGVRFSSLKADRDGLTLTWMRLRELRSARIPRSSVYSLRQSRNVFQKLRGSCSLRIRTVCSEHVLRGLPFDKTNAVLGELGWMKDNII